MNTITTGQLLCKALNTLLRPLVRLLLENGVTYPQLCQQLKTLFVEVADQEMPLEGKAQTHSRISLVSGVHRKDVKRILAKSEGEDLVVGHASLSSKVLGHWLGEAKYLDNKGQPLPLPRLEGNPLEPSFENLVRSINKDVRPRALLDEWLRTGAVSLSEADLVLLNPDSFVSEKDLDQRIHFFARNMRDHIACGVHNLLPDTTDKMLERAVFYDELSPQSIQQLRQLSSKMAMQQLQQLNREALQLCERDRHKPNNDQRFTFGCYYYQTEQQHTKNRETQQ